MKKPNNLVAKHALRLNKSAVFTDRKKASKRNTALPIDDLYDETITKSSVQIIGGEYRRRKIEFYAVNGLRPTGSRIRETLFNWLMPHIEGAMVLDLFVGSGALVFESASRGAKQVIGIESDPLVVKQLQQTKKQLSCNKVDIIHANSEQLLTKQTNTFNQIQPKSIDVVFIDPPFDMTIQASILASLAQGQWLKEGALIYVETDKSSALQIPVPYQLQKQKNSGNVSYYLLSYQV